MDSVCTRISLVLLLSLYLGVSTATAQVSLREIVTTAAGPIVDFDGSRVLVLPSDGLRPFIQTVQGSVTTIDTGDQVMSSGSLCAGGALLSGSSGYWLWSSSLTGLDASRAKAVGNWLAYSKKTASPWQLVLRNLATGEEVSTGPNTPVVPAPPLADFDVTADGVLAWDEAVATLGYFYWLRNGVVSPARPGLSTPVTHGSMLTDGINIVYRRTVVSLVLITQQGTEEGLCGNCVPAARVNAGWTAYADGLTPFVRSPSGTRIPLTNPPQSILPDSVSPTGEVGGRSLENQAVYLLREGQAPLFLRDAGVPIYVEGWFIRAERSVFEVLLDGGTGDAGVGEDAAVGLDGGSGVDDAGVDAGADAAATTDAGTGGQDAGNNLDAGMGQADAASGPPGCHAGHAGRRTGCRDAGRNHGHPGGHPAEPPWREWDRHGCATSAPLPDRPCGWLVALGMIGFAVVIRRRER